MAAGCDTTVGFLSPVGRGNTYSLLLSVCKAVVRLKFLPDLRLANEQQCVGTGLGNSAPSRNLCSRLVRRRVIHGCFWVLYRETVGRSGESNWSAFRSHATVTTRETVRHKSVVEYAVAVPEICGVRVKEVSTKALRAPSCRRHCACDQTDGRYCQVRRFLRYAWMAAGSGTRAL